MRVDRDPDRSRQCDAERERLLANRREYRPLDDLAHRKRGYGGERDLLQRRPPGYLADQIARGGRDRDQAERKAWRKLVDPVTEHEDRTDGVDAARCDVAEPDGPGVPGGEPVRKNGKADVSER